MSNIHPNIRFLWHRDGRKPAAKRLAQGMRSDQDGSDSMTDDLLAGSKQIQREDDVVAGEPTWFKVYDSVHRESCMGGFVMAWFLTMAYRAEQEAGKSALVAAFQTLSPDHKTLHSLHTCREEADTCIALCCQLRYLAVLQDCPGTERTNHPYDPR